MMGRRYLQPGAYEQMAGRQAGRQLLAGSKLALYALVSQQLLLTD